MAKTKTTTKTPTSKVTVQAVMAHLSTARTVNLSRNAKGFYTDGGAKKLATAIAKSHTFPTLTQAGLHRKGAAVSRSPESAQERREFARKNRATLVKVSDILHPNQDGTILHDRPENTIRRRLESVAKAMGLAPNTYYAVRAQGYEMGEVPSVYIVRL